MKNCRREFERFEISKVFLIDNIIDEQFSLEFNRHELWLESDEQIINCRPGDGESLHYTNGYASFDIAHKF